MGRFYANKIVNREINQKTGDVWHLKDVPALWKRATAAALDEMGATV